MILLDSHAFLWWVNGGPELGRRARGEIAAAKRLGVCSISCFEIATAAARNRIELDRPVETWLQDALGLPRVELIPLTPEIAVKAASLGGGFPGDPGDRIIVATALLLPATLVTKDKRIVAAGVVQTIW